MTFGHTKTIESPPPQKKMLIHFFIGWTFTSGFVLFFVTHPVLLICIFHPWLKIMLLQCRLSILSEVSTRSRSKLPSGKNILVFGEYQWIAMGGYWFSKKVNWWKKKPFNLDESLGWEIEYTLARLHMVLCAFCDIRPLVLLTDLMGFFPPVFLFEK